MRASVWKRIDAPTLALSLVAVALLVAYRITTGAGFGFVDDPTNDEPPTGFLANRSDNLTYVAWATQAASGRWLFADAYTLTPHREAYFNPYFLLVGLLSRVARIPVPAVLVLAGIAASAVTIYGVFVVARASGLGTSGARWAAAFAAFGSGISGLATLAHPGGDLVRGADLSYAESVFSSSFYAYPYHTVAYALLVLSAAGAVSLAGGAQSVGASLPRGPTIALVALTATLSATHPYEVVMLVASLVGSAVVASIAGRRQDARRRLVAGSICALGAAPILLYVAWLSSQPVWRQLAGKALANAQPRLAWVLGYGAPGMLAVLGVVRGVRARGAINLDWALSWLLLLTLLLIVLAVPEAKVASGGYLPIAVAAGATMENWTRVGRRSPLLWARVLRGMALGGIIAVSMSSFVFLLAVVFRPRHFDGELSHIARRLGDMGRAPVTVLAPTDAAEVLPALGNIRVYAGEWALTDRYEEKVERLRVSGFEPRDDAPTLDLVPREASEAAFEALVRTVRPQFVVTHRTRPATDFARRSPRLRMVECLGHWCLLQSSW